ncbi:MAG TPA: hypothetical protein VN441_07620, partial [Syntrophomonas sp.]|nr:hypothetical protein [Syntrophomonas sp.]
YSKYISLTKILVSKIIVVWVAKRFRLSAKKFFAGQGGGLINTVRIAIDDNESCTSQGEDLAGRKQSFR